MKVLNFGSRRFFVLTAFSLSLFSSISQAQVVGSSSIEEANPLRHNIVLNGNLATQATGGRVFTVALESVNLDGSVSGTCTGVIIAKDIVLSAGHCFKRSTAAVRVKFGLGGKAGFTDTIVSKKFLWSQPDAYLEPGTGPGLWADGKLTQDEASQARFESSIGSRAALQNFAGSTTVDYIKLLDLAVIRIDRLPAGYGPVKFYSGDVSYGMNVIGIGYGTNSRVSSELDNRLRWSNLSLIGHYTRDGEMTTAWEVYSKQRQLTCFGDSGGPLFVKTAEGYQLLGTLLFVFNKCAESAWYLSPHIYIDNLNEKIRGVRAMNDV